MSLNVELDQVHAVLLADGWHELDPGTLSLGPYEFFADGLSLHRGGNSGTCPTGFEFNEVGGTRIAGPLTSILAYRR